MVTRYFLAGMFVLLGCNGLARAQVALGTPVVPDNSTDGDAKPRANRPVLGGIARSIRAAADCLAPPAVVVAEGPTKSDVARMIADGNHSPAEITAAKIKIDEMQGRARCAAVKYLATVDCHYYPEAEAGLLAALRADRVEAVRLEAATSLGNCRGVTARILDALNLAALGLDNDGNPAESSEAVRMAARKSLNLCMARGMGQPAVPASLAPPALTWQTPVEQPVVPTQYHIPVPPPPPPVAPASATVTPEERLLAETLGAPKTVLPTQPPPRSLFDFLMSFRSPRDASPSTPNPDRSYVEKTTAERMRGLTPLVPDSMMAIPSKN